MFQVRQVWALALVLVAGVATAAQPANVQQIAEGVDRHYNHLQTLHTDFVEIYRGAGIDRRESGTLWLKQPGMMRWEYQQPQEKLFISNGKDAWFYVSGDKQVRKAEVKRLDDLRSPLRYLLGKTKLLREFDGLSLAPDVKPAQAGDVVLRGVPVGMEDRVSQVLLEISPERIINGIVIDEVDGSSTEFRFSNHSENLPIANSRFSFQAPPGVEIVEMRELPQ
jgi:outer membrane lipoprotein carrier protein